MKTVPDISIASCYHLESLAVVLFYKNSLKLLGDNPHDCCVVSVAMAVVGRVRNKRSEQYQRDAHCRESRSFVEVCLKQTTTADTFDVNAHIA